MIYLSLFDRTSTSGPCMYIHEGTDRLLVQEEEKEIIYVHTASKGL